MRRVLAAVAIVALAVALIHGYSLTRRERLYRQAVLAGELAMSRGDTFAAAAAFGDAIGHKPDSMLGYLKRGEARYRRGELDAAAADLAAASERDATATRVLELRGDVELARQKPHAAAEHFSACVALDDRSPRVLYKLGLARLLAGEPQAASESLARAVALDTRMAEGHYLRGVALRELHRPGDAARSLERAVTLAPASAPIREQLAELYAGGVQPAERLEHLETLAAGDPRAPRHVELALAYAGAGQLQKAVRLLGTVARRDTDDEQAYIALGKVWLEASRAGDEPVALAKAIEALQHAVALEPTGDALLLLGEAQLTALDLANAEATLLRACRTFPVDRRAFLLLADAAERQRHHALARSALLDYHSLLPAADPARAEVARRISALTP